MNLSSIFYFASLGKNTSLVILECACEPPMLQGWRFSLWNYLFYSKFLVLILLTSLGAVVSFYLVIIILLKSFGTSFSRSWFFRSYFSKLKMISLIASFTWAPLTFGLLSVSYWVGGTFAILSVFLLFWDMLRSATPAWALIYSTPTSFRYSLYLPTR